MPYVYLHNNLEWYGLGDNLQSHKIRPYSRDKAPPMRQAACHKRPLLTVNTLRTLIVYARTLQAIRSVYLSRVIHQRDASRFFPTSSDQSSSNLLEKISVIFDNLII